MSLRHDGDLLSRAILYSTKEEQQEEGTEQITQLPTWCVEDEPTLRD